MWDDIRRLANDINGNKETISSAMDASRYIVRASNTNATQIFVLRVSVLNGGTVYDLLARWMLYVSNKFGLSTRVYITEI